MIELPLADRVLTALERNPYIARRCLRFENNDVVVTLRGVVNTYFQMQMAHEAVRHVDGVHEIANELEVCWR
ncbi:MAG: BON domain-containing protein [Thermoguttaceae bacterium]